MMKTLFIFLIYLFAVTFQITVMPAFRIFGVQANLLLALSIILAIGDFKKSNFLWIFLIGLMLDIFSGLPFGVYLISLCVVYWFIRYFAKTIFRAGDWFGQAAIIICSCAIFSVLNFIFVALFNLFGLSLYIFNWRAKISIIFFEIIINFCLALLILFILKKINGLSTKHGSQIKKI